MLRYRYSRDLVEVDFLVYSLYYLQCTVAHPPQASIQRLLNNSMKKISQVNLSDKYVVNMSVQLGKGSTGSVYEGKDLRNNQTVAVKVIELATIDNEVTHYLLEMEKKALMAVDNPYVLKGLKIWQDKKFCFMVSEHCNGGTLKQYIHKNGKLDENKSLDLIQKLLEGYQQLVNKKIIHRDLKPANIMLHQDSPKIIDFGYCQIDGYRKPSLQYNVGSPSYMAPQAFDLNIYNEKTEIWAIGVILFECVTGRTIDQGRKMTEAYRQIEQTGIPYPPHVSQKVRNIIDWCLSLSPRKRPTCQQLLRQFDVMRNQQRSLFRETTNQSLLNEKHGDRSRRSSFNEKGDENSDYMMFRSTRVAVSNNMDINMNHLQHSKHRNVQNKYTQNRVRPIYSNYVKPKSSSNTIQQPEVLNFRNQYTDRPTSKYGRLNWDYGISNKMVMGGDMRKKNYNTGPYPVTGRQNFKGISVHQANGQNLADRRASKRVESHYTRPYRI